MTAMPLISLYEISGIGIIVHHPSGVRYSNQVGGVSCLQPIIEGVYVPLVNEVVDQDAMLRDYFTGPKWMGGCSGNMDTEDADYIDQVLKESVFTSFITVDRTKLAESCEAWVYIKLAKQPDERPIAYDSSTGAGIIDLGKTIYSRDFDMDIMLYPLYGFGEAEGILTWINSD